MPQLFASVCVLVHAPAHAVSPVTQTREHEPDEQTVPAPQTVPQWPQLALSLVGSWQALAHSSCGLGQAHDPLLHT